MYELDGFNNGLGNLWRLPKAQSRSISAENFTGEKGKAGMATEGSGATCARDLGSGWKISPSVAIGSGEILTWRISTAPASSKACGLPARVQ